MHTTHCVQNWAVPNISKVGMTPFRNEHHVAYMNITPSSTCFGVHTTHWPSQLQAKQSTPTHLPSRETAWQIVSFWSPIVQQCDHGDANTEKPRGTHISQMTICLTVSCLFWELRCLWALTGVRAVPGLELRWMEFLKQTASAWLSRNTVPVWESPGYPCKGPLTKYDLVKDWVEGEYQDLESLQSEPGRHVLLSTVYVYISLSWMLSLKVTEY